MSALISRLPVIFIVCGLWIHGCGGSERPAVVADAPVTDPDPQLVAIDEVASQVAKSSGVPGLAVGVLRGGKLVSTRGYGTAKDAGAIDEDTAFRLGSITKVFTAAAVLTLRDAGKLSLDEPVARYIPELAPALSPAGKAPVLVRHLLQHASGIPSLGDGTLNWTKGPPITEAQLIASVKNVTLNFEPGSQTEYSNVGMAVAGVLVARMSGISYRDYVTTRILAPLNMHATRWDPSDYESGVVFPGSQYDGAKYLAPASYWVLGAAESMGGLYSTIGDLARFLQFEAEPGLHPTVLAGHSVEESQTPAAAPAGNRIGAGWIVESDSGLRKVVWHNGATYSYGAFAAFDSDTKNGVVVFASTGRMEVVQAAQDLGLDALRIMAGLEPRYTRESAPTGESTAPAKPTDPALVAGTIARVLVLIGSPAEANYASVFSPEFLQQQSVDDVRQFFGQVQTGAGVCERHELLEDLGAGHFKAKLLCSKANLLLTVSVQQMGAQLVEGMMVQFAP